MLPDQQACNIYTLWVAYPQERPIIPRIWRGCGNPGLNGEELRPIKWHFRSVAKMDRPSQATEFSKKTAFSGNRPPFGGQLIRRWTALNFEAHVDRLCNLIGEVVSLINHSRLPFLAF
jgi:hypothetical protein